ncbi:DEAD/DEAH box helicase family protein [Rummeliibacillus pycnus]|uniref:DEAD/DEAH box helicase family protein n=1 Tax=Rummeliibacillus pycnus TaxID=101070 RepID=UPI001474CB24|nr:DEAD/DEAH box helicase family protein [Rummeliibacillus pycnus]
MIKVVNEGILYMMNKRYVSDYITTDAILTWTCEDIVTISADTGLGKSYFIMNTLGSLVKAKNQRILLLVHRDNCKNQFELDIAKLKIEGIIDDNSIDVVTYQSIAAKNINKKLFDFSFKKYDYIVCDEYQYFIEDSSFNHTTDIALKAIMNQSNTIRIFISATDKYMKYYFKDFKKIGIKEFTPPISKGEFIQQLEFYYSDDLVEKFLDYAIENKKKSIFFIDNIDLALKLHQKYPVETFFNCSKGKKEYQHVEEQQINDMLKNKGFNKQNVEGNMDSTEGKIVLISTSCLDAGVTIWDDNLKNIVCDITDTDKMVQCVGRKRLREDEKIVLTLKAFTNEQLGGIQSKSRNLVQKPLYLMENGQDAYIEKYGRDVDKSNIVYITKDDQNNTILEVNEMRYLHHVIKENEMVHINNKYGDFKNRYCEYIKDKFGVNSYAIYEDRLSNYELAEYLESLLGKRLFKIEQNELIDMINYKVNGVKKKSYNKLNERLEMINSSYRIRPGKSGNNRYWIIEKV